MFRPIRFLLLFLPLLAGLASAAEPPAAPPAVPFIEDDYARALAEARARHVPLFIESWAPW